MPSVRRYSTNAFHCWVNCGRRSGAYARTLPDGVVPGTRPAKPVDAVPAPVVRSKASADSKKNGGFRGRRRLAPVPSMNCEIP